MIGMVCGACGALTIGGARHCPKCGLTFQLAQQGLLHHRTGNVVRVSLFAVQSCDAPRPRTRGWPALLALALVVLAVSTWWPFATRPILSPLTDGSLSGLHGAAVPQSGSGGFHAVAVPSFAGRIALAVRRADGTDLLVARETLHAPRRIAHLTGDVRDLAWSPDGHMLAFTWDQDGTSDIYRISAEGDDLHNLTIAFPVSRETQPSWSPDGHAIAFISDHSMHDDVYTLSVDGTQLHQVTDGGTNRRPVWLLDGRILWIAAHGDTWSLATLSASRSARPVQTPLPAAATQLVLAPDQRQLAMVMPDAHTGQVFTITSAGMQLTSRAEESDAVIALAWSPDGTQLLVATINDTAPVATHLALLNPSDGRAIALLHDLGEVRSVAWSSS